MKPRRAFLSAIGALGMSGFVKSSTAENAAPADDIDQYDLVVLGTGFGGTLTALKIAYQKEEDLKIDSSQPRPKILMLERGTWWTTPMETVQDKKVNTRELLMWKKQPMQEWSALNDFKGAIDLVRRCLKTPARPQGLYEFSPVGKRGFIFTKHDGIAVLRANGVGGGSLIYSNITIRPPEPIFEDPHWPGIWNRAAGDKDRNAYFRAARIAIGNGVEALVRPKGAAVNTGLSSIVTRSARINPNTPPPTTPPTSPPAAVPLVWEPIFHPAIPGEAETSEFKRPFYQIRPDKAARERVQEREMIDRARVFQTSMAKLKPDVYGTVELSINDIDVEGFAAAERRPEKPRGKNYCERQGRCNIGCLPGARHTLNKQLMRALYGDFKADLFDPDRPENSSCVLNSIGLELRALAEVDVISALEGGGYHITYRQRETADPTRFQMKRVFASRVIVAAGSLGTTEIMLRSHQRAKETGGREGLLGLSEKLGHQFSGNGDHIAFMEGTKDRVSLTRGPVTTSFAQFNTVPAPGTIFHNVEDQGIPRSLATLTGFGLDSIRSLCGGDHSLAQLPGTVSGFVRGLKELFSLTPARHNPPRPGQPEDMSGNRPSAEDEITANTMCIVAQGKDEADGVFTLEDGLLRVKKENRKAFCQDPVYQEIHNTLERFAGVLAPDVNPSEKVQSKPHFINPLFSVTSPGQDDMVSTSHPLGGCPMGKTIDEGVVDERGRVFKSGGGYYAGLYITDGSTIPAALGVNPSLTISAVALHAAEGVLGDWNRIPRPASPTAIRKECKL